MSISHGVPMEAASRERLPAHSGPRAMPGTSVFGAKPSGASSARSSASHSVSAILRLAERFSSPLISVQGAKLKSLRDSRRSYRR